MDVLYIWSIIPYLLEGLKITVTVFFFTLLFSLPLGSLLATLSMVPSRILTFLITSYTWIFRGTPLLLQLYFGMYGLPIFGITLERLTVAILIFTLNYGAYFTEILRGSILSIDQGQKEVSKTLGFSNVETYIYIILPQAFKRSMQSIGNESITLVKDTALVAAVALSDLLRNAKEIVSRDFKVDAFLVAGVYYLLFTLVVVIIIKFFEKKTRYFN
jgi:polar amino acid transport system permease protein